MVLLLLPRNDIYECRERYVDTDGGESTKQGALLQLDILRMSMSGEVTAVHISRKPSSVGSRGDTLDFENEKANEESRSSRPPSGRHRPKSGRPATRNENKDQVMRADSDQIDLDKLLSSMLDINEHKNGRTIPKGELKQRPFSAYPASSNRNDDGYDSVVLDGTFVQPRTRLRPFSAHSDKEHRTNYSFSNNKVEQIDRENHRLLKALMSHQKKIKQPSHSKKAEPLKVHASATLNRFRHQQQIERENLAFLRRLEKVKPTKDLARDHLLREHFKQEQFAKNVSRSKRRPASAIITQTSRKSCSISDLRHIDTDSVASSGVTAQRHQRTGSARKQLRNDDRPVWEAGW